MAATEMAVAPRPPAAALRPAPARDRAATVLLAVLVAACAYAAFAHGAIDLRAEARLQATLALTGLAVAALAFGAGRLVPRTGRAGWTALGLLGGFAAWCGVSLAWSETPDLSWVETNRAIAYTLVAVLAIAVGSRAPRAAERAAAGLLAVAVAAALYALFGKVAPGVIDGTRLSPRLRDPIGYWNALALLCVLAMPAAMRFATDDERGDRARLAALAALWVLIVAAALTYSRGAVLALGAAAVVVTALGSARLRGLAVLGLAAAAAAPGLALAFTRDTLAHAGTPLGERIAAGRGLGIVLGVSLLALLGAGRLALAAERRGLWRPAWTRRAWAAIAVGAAATVVALLVSGALASTIRDFGNTSQAPSISDPSRLLSTNSGNRVTWWNEALGAWSARPLTGHGAGSFPVLHLQYRHNTLAVRQPHDVPLEFLAETGAIGGVLGVGGVVLLVCAAAAGAVRRARGTRERELAIALLAAGVAWAVHALVDWDWDIPAVTVPALLALGVAAAHPGAAGEPRPRARALALVAAALAGWVYLISIALPALADAKADAALREARGGTAAALEDAAAHADLATRLDPLAVRALFAGAAIAERRDRPAQARRLLLDAVDRQPDDAQAWARLSQAAADTGDRAGALAAARAALRLDPLNRLLVNAIQDAEAAVTPPQDSPTATGTPLA